MPCGNRLMALLVNRPLEGQVRFVEVLVRVTGAVSRLPDRVRVRDRVVASVTRLDLVVVQVEAASSFGSARGRRRKRRRWSTTVRPFR